jgi:hypothetical protein
VDRRRPGPRKLGVLDPDPAVVRFRISLAWANRWFAPAGIGKGIVSTLSFGHRPGRERPGPQRNDAGTARGVCGHDTLLHRALAHLAGDTVLIGKDFSAPEPERRDSCRPVPRPRLGDTSLAVPVGLPTWASTAQPVGGRGGLCEPSKGQWGLHSVGRRRQFESLSGTRHPGGRLGKPALPANLERGRLVRREVGQGDTLVALMWNGATGISSFREPNCLNRGWRISKIPTWLSRSITATAG